MKKFLTSMLVLSLLVIQSAMASAYQSPYQKYLNGDRNYIIFDGHMGDARYLIRNSLRVVKDSYPELVLSIESVYVPQADRGNVTPGGERGKYQFTYDRKARKLYSGNHYFPPNTTARAQGAVNVVAGEMTYYLATGERFYGTFSDEFYDI